MYTLLSTFVDPFYKPTAVAFINTGPLKHIPEIFWLMDDSDCLFKGLYSSAFIKNSLLVTPVVPIQFDAL